jgi:uncharacterized coiled-coil protein SlyX
MKLEEAISKLRLMLTEVKSEVNTQTEIQLATAELVDGTIVKTEGEIEVGKTLLVETPEGDVPAPEGIHQTTDNLLISVDASGVIISIEPVVEEVEEKSEFSDKLLSEISSMISPITEQINSIKDQISTLKGEFHAFKEEPAGKKITNNIVENARQVESMYEAKMAKILTMRNGKK